MVIVTFPNRETQEEALGFLMQKFSGSALKSGEHIIPEAAVEALAEEGFVFTVKGKATHEKQMEALRSTASRPVQRRQRHPRKVARQGSKRNHARV